MSETGDREMDRATQEKCDQVTAQYKVVVHLAKAIAGIHEQCAPLICGAYKTDSLLDMQGRRSARIMELLGDILNGMDAIDETEDEWVNPIFQKAHEVFPPDANAE